jgi:hypothetical protein
VAYASRQFSKDEIRLLSSPAKELCSILYGVTLWNALIARSKIIVKTDCICWSYLALASATSNRMSHLGMILSEHNILIEHIPGTQNKASDGLSRAFDATLTKVDDYKINKDQRVELLTAPPHSTEGPIPMADYLHKCQLHIQQTWPPSLEEPQKQETTLIAELFEALNPEGAPKKEEAYINRVTQPIMQRHDIQPIDIKCDPTINVMTPQEAANFSPMSPYKVDRIALVAMNETAFTPEAFAALQSADPEITHRKTLLLNKADKKGYFVRNGIVMHEYTDQNGIVHPAVYIPQVLIKLILSSYHVTVLGGHQSSKKIERDLKRKFYWPHMKTTIKAYCQDCVPCAYNKKYPVGFTQGKLITPLYPNHLIFMDITGGLPTSYDGCSSLLLIFDGFSKFSFGIPLKNRKAAYVAKLFVQQYVQAFGMPQLLHTDNAGNMTGSILSYIAKMLGCKKTETPSWCPRADPAETLVSCVGDLLRIHMSKKDQKMWTIVLPFIINGLNATVSSSTLFTPSEIFLGRAIENTPIPLMPGDHPEITSDEWMMAVRRGQEYKYEIIRKRARAIKCEYRRIAITEFDSRVVSQSNKLIPASHGTTAKVSQTKTFPSPDTIIRNLAYTCLLPAPQDSHKESHSIPL